MTVLVLIPCLLTGGTEIQTLSLVRALVCARHDVVVGCYFEHAPAMRRRYEEAGATVRLFSPDGTRPRGIIPTARHLWTNLRATVRDIRPDAAHVQYMAPGALPILILRLLGVRRILATAHTAADIYTPNGLRLIHHLTAHTLSGFQCITRRAELSFFNNIGTPPQPTAPTTHETPPATSIPLEKSKPRNLETSRATPQPRDKHFTIYNCLPSGIDVMSSPEEKTLMKDGIVTIGVVGSLVPIKGMDLVLPAFNILTGNVRLYVIGDGILMEEMKRQADSRVTFYGTQQHENLQRFYDRIDILLMPSRSEGFGLTAIEGMARACVPVVADTGGLPEVVQDNVNGLLHTPGSPEDLAAKIQLLIDSPSLLRTLSAAALRRAHQFTFPHYAAQIQAWYQSLQ